MVPFASYVRRVLTHINGPIVYHVVRDSRPALIIYTILIFGANLNTTEKLKGPYF